jgi:hypothetical protein
VRLRPARAGFVALVAVVVALPLLAGCSKDDGKALPKPKTPETTTTTDPVDLTQVSLQPISVTDKATTTTRPVGGGQGSIFGRVVDSNGAPVPGAFIRATYYGDPSKPEIIEALSLDDGTYRFDKVLGGQWRIRAWKTPQLATLADEVFFLGFTEQRQVDLKVKAADDYTVTSSIAPNPPFTGSPIEVAVLVLSQTVDDNGIVHRSGVGGATVTLNVTGRWYLPTDASQTTDSGGRAAWTLTCMDTGSQPISAIVGGREWPLNLPGCHDPMETTTTTTTAPPPGASSTTSSTKPKPKTSSSTTSTRPKSYATTSTRPAGGHT